MTEEAAKPLASKIPAGGADQPPRVDSKVPPSGPGRWKRLSLWKKIALLGAAATPILVVALWIAVHSIPWMGPLVANTLRSIVGKENVTRLEEFVYSIEDRANRTFKAGDKPKAYWKVPEKKSPTVAPSEQPLVENQDSAEKKPELPVFTLRSVGPVHQAWSAEGDGEWVALLDPRRPDEAPRMYKTLLHPDKSRSWSELFVVAIDLRQVEVMPVMGYQEPRTDKKEAEGYKRPAKIPPQHYEALLAAFNGGFMAEHGHYGVYFDGIVFLDPKDDACTLAKYKNGTYEVASWTRMKERFTEMEWYRQAPNCMYENGEMHPNLKIHYAKKWGATLDGNTVIRRSAVGLSKDGTVLYVGISNHTNAKVMALGMNHAGAQTVAQMDVNWSYPKFVTYEKHDDGLLYPVALADGFEFSDKLYLRERSMRDFFYLVRKEEIAADSGAPAPPPTAGKSADKEQGAALAPSKGASDKK